MGHRQQMNPEQRLKWDSESYKRKLEANRGSNFEYWSDKHEELLQKGWQLFRFDLKQNYEAFSTSSELEAKGVVNSLKCDRNFARIVCGYNKNVQRQKRYSILFKAKKV